MAFDTTTRNRLASFVAAARGLIADEFTEQFQSLYGISATGDIAPLDRLSHLDEEGLGIAARLRERIDYLIKNHPHDKDGAKVAVARLAREQAFTVLNRLAAVRMAEKRGIIVESVGQSYQSKGFKVFETVAGSALGDTFHRYRCYLFCLFDELAIDLGILFDRRSPHALLFPREPALLALLNLLNAQDLQDLWAEDETIGWIYQYYNDPAERKKMRDPKSGGSDAPRNSYELAVRNQFFTPRYVVEFLTDNTLGRLWYEMTKGQTALKDQCRYLVRRPNEVFLRSLHDAYRAVYGRDVVIPKDLDSTDAFAALYRGDMQPAAKGESGFFALAGGALSEQSFRTATGESWDQHGNECIEELTQAILGERDHPKKKDIVWGWAAISQYLENSQIGSPYAHDSTRKLEGYFRGLLLSSSRSDEMSQEELIRQPVLIPHRPLKDPREIRLLDPACGSMHFGLYAFDLFTVIYDEAWEIAHGSDDAARSADTFAPFVTFATSFTDKTAFLREVPRLIVEHNIHGIDIDPRAAQIAGLSLWLRAQRAWHQASVKPADRPRITRSNLVCAEPMPGEKELLREFVEQQFPAGERPAFAFLLEKIFDCMTLAGEAGSLLRIEEEIRTTIADARRLWKEGPKAEQATLFAEPGEKVGQGEMRLDLSGITDEQFWERAEQRIYDALEAYAEQAENGGGFQRRLFADDAAQGFAFIDLCRKRYDVAVMNPPFGLPTAAVEVYAKESFESTWQDIYASFFDRTLGFTKGDVGYVGAITPKSFYHAKGFRGLRNLLKAVARLTYSVDIGGGVLDAAVEVCFSIVQSRPSSMDSIALFCNLVSCEKPLLADKVLRFVDLVRRGEASREVVPVAAGKDVGLPNEMLPYRFPADLLKLLQTSPSFEASSGSSVVGITTFDNDRFIRLSWETAETSRSAKEWLPVAMGGGWDPFYAEFNLVVKWARDAAEMRANELRRYDTTARTMQSQRFWFRPGLTFSKISTLGFSTQPFPAGSIFTSVGFCIFSDKFDNWTWLGYFNSKPVCCLMSLFSADRHWHSNSVAFLPIPAGMSSNVAKHSKEAFTISVQLLGRSSETAPEFLHCDIAVDVAEKADAYQKLTHDLASEISISFGLSTSTLEFLSANAIYAERDFSVSPEDLAKRRLSYFLGCAFGRWDIRYATGERSEPELPDPFAPLPVCPPGMLQGDDGLPLSPEAGRRLRAEGRYPLDVAWDGILVDDPEHPLDLEHRVHAALAALWGDRADTVEHEACALLGVPTLREWFRRPAGFFADHLKRYSKSRRQAPIYWPLSTASGSYTLWIYYHRLTDQTLHKALADFVAPKLRKVQAELDSLNGQTCTRAGELREFLDELKDLHDEIERIIKLPWKPNLNDGVLITASPLHNLFRLPKWKKDLKACWDELAQGDYDWAHLAHSIWPLRVEKACEKDRSLAIAHGLEHLCKVEIPKPKAKRAAKKATTTQESSPELPVNS
jgi:hypothetical protein